LTRFRNPARPQTTRSQTCRTPTQGGLGLRRFLRLTGDTKLRVDKAAVAREAHFDGTFLLRSSDERLAAEEIATGYKALYKAGRCWRDLKSTINLRPVFHRREDRIRAHVQLSWLALLLARVAEVAAHDTWRNLRNELERLHLVTMATKEGTVSQCSHPASRNGNRSSALLAAEALVLQEELPGHSGAMTHVHAGRPYLRTGGNAALPVDRP